MGRWVAAIVLLASALAVGGVAFLNGGDPTPIRVTPGRTIALPLGTALGLAFASGAALIALLALAAATTRAVGRWRLARGHARRAARLSRERVRAETLLVGGQPDVARSRLAGAVTANPSDARLLELYAGAAEQSGDLSVAIKAVEDARAASPDSPFLARRLSHLYAAAGRWEDALALETEVVRTLRGPAAAAEADTVRGLRLEAAAADPDPALAIDRLLALAREHPGFIAAWVLAGDRLHAAGHTARARRAYEAGADARPASVLIERLAALDAEAGQPDRTIRTLRWLRRRHPMDAGVLAALVRQHLQQDGLDDAEAALASWPVEGPGAPAALEALRGEACRRRGRFEQAAAHLARAVAGAVGAGHRCAACGRAHDLWAARCASCGRWDTIEAAPEGRTASTSGDLMSPPSRTTLDDHCVTEAPG
jgi:lipopolysaccharide biosynthesis regulator YciM